MRPLAHSRAGHGSMINDDNAVTRLAGPATSVLAGVEGTVGRVGSGLRRDVVLVVLHDHLGRLEDPVGTASSSDCSAE